MRNMRLKTLQPQRLLLLPICLLLGGLIHIWWVHVTKQSARLSDGRTKRYTPSTTARTLSQPAPTRNLTLISSLYTGAYSTARIAELRLVALRNANLRSVTRYELVHDVDDTTAAKEVAAVLRNGSWAKIGMHVVRNGEAGRYETLLRRGNEVAGKGDVVVIANADIYFDASLSCAKLVRKDVILALSRHAGPDCALASGSGDTGWEPGDFCAGYDKRRAASHDVFVYVAPMKRAVVEGVGRLRTNEFGAENVVVKLVSGAGYETVNACGNVHAFHQHCDVGQRAGSARQLAGSVAEKRGEFGGTGRSGFVGMEVWAEGFGPGEGLDCLAYGMLRDG